MEPLTKRQKAGLFGKLLLVVTPALVTGFFSYRTARVEAEAKVSVSHSQAEAGYQTLVDAVRRQEERIKQLEAERAALKSKPELRPLPPVRIGRIGSGIGSGAAGLGIATKPPPAPPVVLKPLKLPDTLESAQVQRMASQTPANMVFRKGD